MISESEVRGRYLAYEQELQQLDQEIYRLRLRVRMGSEHWRVDLERLAERAERRRALDAQWQALRWVLVPETSESEQHVLR
jgi:hypothetical protein